MNDADLRAALHRDAELAGEPPADLLDRLRRRRDRQRHQRLGIAASVLGVVLVAGGVPLAASLLDGPDGGPAAPPPTTSAPSSRAPSSSPLPAPPGCPDAAALLDLLPAATGGDPQPTLGAPSATCSGDWAVIGVRYGQAQSVALFRFADGSWRPEETAAACEAGDLPPDLVDGVCNAG